MPFAALKSSKTFSQVTGTTICGSDLHLYHGEIVALQKNDILGHEFMGVVDAVGPGVTKLKKGDVSWSDFEPAPQKLKDLSFSGLSYPSKSPAESAGTASRSSHRSVIEPTIPA